MGLKGDKSQQTILLKLMGKAEEGGVSTGSYELKFLLIILSLGPCILLGKQYNIQ